MLFLCKIFVIISARFSQNLFLKGLNMKVSHIFLAATLALSSTNALFAASNRGGGNHKINPPLANNIPLA